MKQSLNEEISRIKSMMGCCKGKINEDIQLDSQQEAQMMQMVAQDFQEMGITQEDLEINNNANLGQAKQELANKIVEPFLQKAKKEDIKELIKALKNIKQNYKSFAAEIENSKSQPPVIGTTTQPPVSGTTTQSINEQRLFDMDRDTLVTLFIDGFKFWLISSQGSPIGRFIYISLGLHGFLIAITSWLIINMLKCYIFDVFGNKTNNIINKLVQVITLDIDNLFSPDPYVRGCGLVKNY